MAERIVDRLEIIEVEEQHRDRVRHALCTRECMTHLIQKERTVGQVRERIVKRLMHVLLLDHTLFGHVTRVEHETANDRLAQQIRADVVHRHPVAVRMTQAPLALHRSRLDVTGAQSVRTGELLEKVQRWRRIVGV